MLGFEFMDFGLLLVVQWVIVLVINIVPALAPPTWAVLSFFYITRSQDIWVLVFIGVSASTIGRFILAKLSGFLATKFASPKKMAELNLIEKQLSKKGWEKFIFTVIYALSPLPSNALFIAFGATKTRLREILAGFVIGRTLSYLFLVFTTEKVFSSFQSTMAGNMSLLTIVVEVIGVIAIIVFFKFDWNSMIKLEGNGKKMQKRWAHKSSK